jgi:hypothetical protein
MPSTISPSSGATIVTAGSAADAGERLPGTNPARKASTTASATLARRRPPGERPSTSGARRRTAGAASSKGSPGTRLADTDALGAILPSSMDDSVEAV